MMGCGMQRLGERVYAEGENDEEGKCWGYAEEARGNKNPAMPWGLRDENCYFAECGLSVVRFIP